MYILGTEHIYSVNMPKKATNKNQKKKPLGQLLLRRQYVAKRMLKGVDYRTISVELKEQGFPSSLGTIAKDVKWALDEWRESAIKDTADHVQLQLKRLDEILKGIWNDATSGNPAHVDSALKIMDRQAKLLGLDKPKMINHMFPDGMKLTGVNFDFNDDQP